MVAHNATPFVGRLRELDEIASRLNDPYCRLLTLVGPGGIGKTRLALEAARQFPEAHFVPLQPLTSSDFIISALADAIGFQFYSGSGPKQQLLDFLCEKSWLLILDNFEHLLDGATLLSEILAAAPAIRLLITSRERLNLVEEWVLDVGGLTYPRSKHEADTERYSAVELFVQHARRVKSSFSLTDTNHSAVIRICRLVGGMPLGIELAASWVRALSCEAIAEEIERSLDILEASARNVEPRHRTMRAAFEPTWARLTDDERDVFMKLSVFRGGFTREAAREVVGASLRTLTALADKSLLRIDANGRYDVHELLRQYATDKLVEAGEIDATALRHLAYFLKLAEQREANLHTLHVESPFDQWEVEHDNLRAALAWSMKHDRVEMGYRLAEALSAFWEQRGFTREAYGWYEKLLEITQGASAIVRANVAGHLGEFCIYAGDDQRARVLVEESLRLARASGDKQTIGWALNELGWSVESFNDLHRATVLIEEQLSIFRELEDPNGIRIALRALTWFATAQGDYERAKGFLDEALMRARDAEDETASSWVVFLSGNLVWFQTRNPQRALALYEESLALGRKIRNLILLPNVLFMIGQLVRSQGDYPRAHACYEECLTLVREGLAKSLEIAHMLAGFAGLITTQLPEQATRLFGATDAYLRKYTSDHFPFGKPMNYDHDIAAACVQLGEEQFATIFAEGQRMTLSQVLNYALKVRPLSSAQASDVDAKADRQPALPSFIEPLTARELEILRFLVTHRTNPEIADALFITVGTVKTHVHHICNKLQVTKRQQAVERAVELHLL